jgi:hypothetical protein
VIFGAVVVPRSRKPFLSASFWSVTANLFHLTRRSTRPLMGLGDNRNSARGALTEALGVKTQFGGNRFVLGSRLGFVGGFSQLLFAFAWH